MEAPNTHAHRFCGGVQIAAKRVAGIDGRSCARPENPFMPLPNARMRRMRSAWLPTGPDGEAARRCYETYCPKAFALIGDVHDTLRDRSIVVEMRRGEPARRFVYAAAKEEGAALRERLSAALSSQVEEIDVAVRGFEGLKFLFDRDEEIWSPLFILCRLICGSVSGFLLHASSFFS